MKEDKLPKNLILLAETTDGVGICWDTETGVKNASFKVVKGKKVAKADLQEVKSLSDSSTFTTYRPNVWF